MITMKALGLFHGRQPGDQIKMFADDAFIHWCNGRVVPADRHAELALKHVESQRAQHASRRDRGE